MTLLKVLQLEPKNFRIFDVSKGIACINAQAKSLKVEILLLVALYAGRNVEQLKALNF